MRNLSATFPACRASLRTLSCVLLLCAAIQAAHAQRAENAQAAGGFSPGARASASANATLDSVVGNRPSPVKKEVSLGGAVYRVTPQATVIGPDGKAISGGCPAPDTLAEGQFVAGGAPAEPALRGNGGAGTNSRKSETVMIGVTDQRPAGVAGNGAHVPLKPAATMNASFGPAGVYVLPVPCRQSGSDRQAMINDAAASLASAGGNAFALAGNRDGMKEATQATTLADGDIMLSVAQPDNAAPRLVQIDTAHQGAVR
ncbi:hypothetical protein [Asaia prunellae]|uniref:hypothetical protein n=1 Tax=Asaia prunellae TaxID=610245 RepID=UPI00046E7828|nr:hypothetical protein [Asaia prunellae]